MIDSIFDSLISEGTDKEYYHLSANNYGEKVKFTPRNPDVPGESNLPRICVATTIEGALVALGSLLYVYGALHVFIYQATGDPEIISPNRSVVDRKITGEMWIVEPTVFERVGKLTKYSMPRKLWTDLQSLHVGTISAIPEQAELKDKIAPYVSSKVGVAEAFEEEEDKSIRTVPAPMNFDRARAKNK